MLRTGIVAAVLFVLAHFAMLIGVTTPEKFYFDEVHYVPAARQMLEPVMPQPMLNPMHPPLAKQFIALSIHSFGDGPLGWRYPGVLFGSLAIVAVYLCGLALFAAQGPAIAASLLAFFNQMLFVQSRIAMLDIFALTFSLFAIAAFMHGFRRERPHLWFALAGIGFGLSIGCKWSGLFVLAVCIVIVAVIRLMQSWRTQFADARPEDWYRPDLWPDFRWWHFAICFVLIPAAVYLATFIPLYGFSFPDILQAQRRIFGDNTTTAIAGHTYMSSWPSWPFLVRPVWYLFDKIGDDRIAAVVFLGNPLILWPALIAVAICLRDWIVTRRVDAFLVLAFYFGPYLAWALLPRTLGFIYYYLPAATTASFALVYALKRGSMPALAAVGLCCGWFCRLCRNVADIGRVHRHFDGDVQPPDDLPELDLRRPLRRERTNRRVVLPSAIEIRLPQAAGGLAFKTSLRRGLGVHVDDLNAAVGRVHRRIRILRLGLAVTDGHEVGAGDAVLLGQVLLDRVGAALGKILVIRFAADRVGMTGNHEGRTLQARIGERLAEFLHGGHRALADVGRVVVELDFEIDLRLARGKFRNLLALAERQRPRLAVAQRVDEADFLGLYGDVHRLLRAGRKAAGHARLRLQGVQDFVGRDGVAGGSQACRHRQRGADSHDRKKAGHCLNPHC